jgi:hypothetical protein
MFVDGLCDAQGQSCWRNSNTSERLEFASKVGSATLTLSRYFLKPQLIAMTLTVL